MTKLRPGTRIPDFHGVTARGNKVSAASLRGKPVLLQFHRFAACPACFVSVHEFASRIGEIRDQGLEVVAFFYSTPEELAESFKALAPEFELVGDPGRRIFDLFGVERSLRRFLKPQPWITAMVGWTKGAGFAPVANLTKEDTRGVPADFLVDAGGVLRYVHYGSHAADSMSVNDVLETYRSLRLAA